MRILQPTTLAADATEELLRLLRQGEFKPGQLLPPQKDLATSLGVSPSTLREAVQALVAMGILESRPGKGTWLSQDAFKFLVSTSVAKYRLGTVDAFKVYQARRVIEVGLVELAAQNATAEDIAAIWDTYEQLRTCVNDEAAFGQADFHFHWLVAQASHNELLCQFYGLARDLVSHVVSELVQLPNVRETTVGVEYAIAAAIAAHNREEAVQAANAHMDYIAPFFAGTADAEA
jgi:GntR family transcriptional regulator, transcriptional repressor for pyruvate dehydrogenase complex